LFGSPTVTNDLDICCARDQDNLERLAAALVELEARLRGGDEAVPFLLDAETLRNGDRFTFVTRAGSLDILASPSGIRTSESLHGEPPRWTWTGCRSGWRPSTTCSE
jgi:hypothetical protein